MLKILKMFVTYIGTGKKKKPKRSKFALLSIICLKKVNSIFSARIELTYIYLAAVSVFS